MSKETVLSLVLAFSAELSCRSGTENLNPMGGTAATPEPTNGGVYTSFCCPDLVCSCQGRETVSRSLSLGFFPVLTPCVSCTHVCRCVCGPLTSTLPVSCHALHALHSLCVFFAVSMETGPRQTTVLQRCPWRLQSGSWRTDRQTGGQLGRWTW